MRIQLAKIEKESAAWRKIMEQIDERIAQLMNQLCGDIDERKANKLRGAIAELKELRASNEEDPVIHSEDY